MQTNDSLSTSQHAMVKDSPKNQRQNQYISKTSQKKNEKHCKGKKQEGEIIHPIAGL